MAAPGVTREKREAPVEETTLDASGDESWVSLLQRGRGVTDELEGDDGGEGPELEDQDGEEDDEDGDGDGAGELEESADEADDEDADEPESDEAAEQSGAAGDRAEYVNSWAAKVVAKPLTIMQVPPKERRAVLEQAFKAKHEEGRESLRPAAVAAVQQAARDAYERGQADLRAAMETDAEIEEVAELAETDPEMIGQWANGTAEQRRKVAKFMAHRDAEEAGPAAESGEELRAAAGAVLEKVKGNAAALKKLQDRQEAEPNRYVGVPGLANLSADTAEVLAELKAEELAKAREPKRKAAQEREAAAAERGRLPRAPGSAGRVGGGPGNNGAAPGDWRALLTQGFAESRKARQK